QVAAISPPNCCYSHDPKDNNAATLSSTSSPQPTGRQCSSFWNGDVWKYGDRCKFEHVRDPGIEPERAAGGGRAMERSRWT
ncbi:hypothetical protein HK405_014336, partial [Cladochytrium tenue]